MSNLFRLLPSVDKALESLAGEPGLDALPRALVRDLVNEFLDVVRGEIRDGRLSLPAELSMEALGPRLARFVASRSRPHFRRVINATGVVIHTNLGRSLMAEEAIAAVELACRHYSNLEFDLATGKRGSRYSHVEEILCKVTGAEAGLVVNNNASAVLIVLDTLAKGREAVTSRGELIEIGGSFRIPDVMAKSGAILREVGTTNRTHPRDYESAICEETGLLMKVHTSNYRIVGFTREVEVDEMAAIGAKHGIPVMLDLGSGNFYDFTRMGFAFEPTVQECVRMGADVVTFSGDKVLGGPQAGVIVGKRRYIDEIKKNPLNRAVRIDKMTLAALEATFRLYLDPELARQKVPTLNMITATPAELKAKASRLARVLRRKLGESAKISLAPGVSRVGGGSFPERDLPTTLIAIDPADPAATPDGLKAALLTTDPPMVGRIEEDRFHLDPRTINDKEFADVAQVLADGLSAAAK